MTSMRRRCVAWTPVRRHVPAENLPPPLGPQYSSILNLAPPPPPPNILNLPTPMCVPIQPSDMNVITSHQNRIHVYTFLVYLLKNPIANQPASSDASKLRQNKPWLFTGWRPVVAVFFTFLFLVTDILCLVIQYFGKIN